MENFMITLIAVFVMFLYAIPGFILMKLKMVKESHIKTISTILIYVFSPCMIISSFLSVERSKEMVNGMLLFALATTIIQILFVVIIYLILRKKYDDAKYRMFTIGSVCGNVGFFGLPLVKAVLPEYPIALAYSSIYVFTMNLLVFTIGCFCITKNKKYISIKQAFINPTSIALYVAIILYALNVKLSGNLFMDNLGNAVDLLGKMTTPVCMLILGMRLACVNLKNLFTRPIIYLNILTKLVIFPLLAYVLVYFLPLDYSFKASILVLSSVPCASVILNLAEMYDTNQELAANSVLLTTLFSVISIPIILLIL